jgi:hypothetical protein
MVISKNRAKKLLNAAIIEPRLHIVKQKGQETPENGEIHTENGKPYTNKNSGNQTDSCLNNQITLHDIDEPAELGEGFLRNTEDCAKFYGKARGLEQYEHYNEQNQDDIRQHEAQTREQTCGQVATAPGLRI